MVKDIIDNVENKIEQLIYEFVYRLGTSAANPRASEYSYYIESLSGDNKFMNIVQKLYENRHKGFERGYQMLTNKQ